MVALSNTGKKMRYVSKIILIAFTVGVSFAAAGLTTQPSAQFNPIEPPRTAIQNLPPATTVVPVVVKVQLPPKSKEDIQQDTDDRNERIANDRETIDVNVGLVIVGALQLLVFGYQAYKLKQTVRAAADQSGDMKTSINEAKRAATAMEGVAKAMATNAGLIAESVETSKKIAEQQKLISATQLRAYLSATIGGAVFQDKESNLKFEGKALLVNDGHTPAHKVTHKVQAAILPFPLSPDFVLPTFASPMSGEGMIGPRQNRTLSAVVADFVDDNEIDNIKFARSGRALYMWGIIEYEDVFGASHRTEFCHHLIWFKDNNTYGYYTPNRNSAT